MTGNESGGTAPGGGPSPLSTDEVLRLAGHAADLSAAALPLPDGLRALADEAPGHRLGRVARDLADRLDAGQSLEDALDATAGRLPEHLRVLLATGARTGRLPRLLGDYMAHRRLRGELRRTLAMGLLYPALLLAAFGAIFLLMVVFLVPQFRAIFEDFNIPLPLSTQVLLSLSSSFTTRPSELGVRTIVALAALVLGWRFLLQARERRLLLGYFPLVGSLWRWSAQAECCQYMALLIEAERPLTEAVRLAAEATDDAELIHENRQVVAELERGRPLGEALTAAASFPPGVAVLLGWAEGRQALPEILRTVASVLAARARTRASMVASIVLMLAVLTILWGVSFAVGALLVPLVQLISRLSG